MAREPIILSFKADIPVWRQLDVHDVHQVGVPSLIGLKIDVDAIVKLLGPKALETKGKRATRLNRAIQIQVKELVP